MAEEEKSYWFKCPKCGRRTLEEIQDDVLVATEIEDVIVAEDGGAYRFQYGDQAFEDGMIVRYQCVGCGKAVVDEKGKEVTDEDELLDLIYYNKTEWSEED